MFVRQITVTLTEPLAEFVGQHNQYGFQDPNAMIRAALTLMKRELEQDRLRESAALYAEVYAEDGELRELAESAAAGWPE